MRFKASLRASTSTESFITSLLVNLPIRFIYDSVCTCSLDFECLLLYISRFIVEETEGILVPRLSLNCYAISLIWLLKFSKFCAHYIYYLSLHINLLRHFVGCLLFSIISAPSIFSVVFKSESRRLRPPSLSSILSVPHSLLYYLNSVMLFV